jgi:hypothetical protein
MRLQDRGTCSCNFSSLAAKVAGSTHAIKTSMGGRKLRSPGKRSLSCGLFGSIHINHEPVTALAVPEATRGKVWAVRETRSSRNSERNASMVG